MKVVIVGNGIAGITCAQELRKREPEIEILVIGKETEYFFSRTALMYAFMDKMNRRDLEPFERQSYARQNIALLHDEVIDLNHKTQMLCTKAGLQISYDKLVLALGSRPNLAKWPGMDAVKDGVVHFVSMQDLDACERLTPSTKEAVIVGGGLIGIELAECLAFHGIKVTFLIREPFFWPVALAKEEAALVAAEMENHGITVRYNEEICKIETDSSGRVAQILTTQDNVLPAQMLGVCVGVAPAIDFLHKVSTPPRLGRGVRVNDELETSLAGVFACGDCAEIQLSEGLPPFVELIWYSAKRQGALAARNVLGDRSKYSQPIFYNSSKFFELEYTTVGEVMQLPDGTRSLFCSMPKKRSSLRIVYDPSRGVIGFNILGARFDNNILEKWISERRSVDYCFKNLKSAQYDVEFGRVPFEKATIVDLPLDSVKSR